MKICLAGADASEKYNKIMLKCKANSKLESFYSLGKKEPSKGFNFYLLDSGGFVARTRGIEIDVENYAEYIVKNNIKKAFNLDTMNLEQTLYNQKFLENNTNAYIIPIWHPDDKLELLKKYCSYPYIGLGGISNVIRNKNDVYKFYSKVFNLTQNKIKVHGLGQTSKKVLEMFPFYSVDSTSWLSFAQFGNSKVIKGNLAKVYAKKNSYIENTEIECKYWVNLEKYITNLWIKRGVVWND